MKRARKPPPCAATGRLPGSSRATSSRSLGERPGNQARAGSRDAPSEGPAGGENSRVLAHPAPAIRFASVHDNFSTKKHIHAEEHGTPDWSQGGASIHVLQPEFLERMEQSRACVRRAMRFSDAFKRRRWASVRLRGRQRAGEAKTTTRSFVVRPAPSRMGPAGAAEKISGLFSLSKSADRRLPFFGKGGNDAAGDAADPDTLRAQANAPAQQRRARAPKAAPQSRRNPLTPGNGSPDDLFGRENPRWADLRCTP